MARIVHTVVDAAKDFFASRYPGYQLARFEHSFGKTIFHLEPLGQAICLVVVNPVSKFMTVHSEKSAICR